MHREDELILDQDGIEMNDFVEAHTAAAKIASELAGDLRLDFERVGVTA